MGLLGRFFSPLQEHQTALVAIDKLIELSQRLHFFGGDAQLLDFQATHVIDDTVVKGYSSTVPNVGRIAFHWFRQLLNRVARGQSDSENVAIQAQMRELERVTAFLLRREVGDPGSHYTGAEKKQVSFLASKVGS